MGTRIILPSQLGDVFSVKDAAAIGMGRGRLRGPDLERPFFGVRRRKDRAETPMLDDPYERQRQALIAGATAYAARMHPAHHISHHSAAALWGAPLPLSRTAGGSIAEPSSLPVHVTAVGPVALPRATGVARHRGQPEHTRSVELRGIRVATPATTWASLGTLPLFDLIALGDFLCRAWRPGRGRRDVGRRPLATLSELTDAVGSGRRVGIGKLREAITWIREDSWSPRESRVRCILLSAGLPEPELNVDIYEDGEFLGCGDLVYRARRVVVEYHGFLHGAQWAADVERASRLRAAGWNVIEVTAELLKRPDDLAARVRTALRR